MSVDPYSYSESSASSELECSNGRSVIPRRLPPTPSFSSPRTSPSPSPSPPPPSSVFSFSSSSSPGASSPASSLESTSPNQSPTKSLTALKRVSRPLPQVPGPRLAPSPNAPLPIPSHSAHLIVCRRCLNCVTTRENLLPASAVPPGSRAFRGFSGKASLFTECYSVTFAKPRVQLMTTGAHTMQETFCASCSARLGWKIVKAHEKTEKWKEGRWLLELESLWLARSSDVLDSSFAKAVERECERNAAREKERGNQARVRRESEYELASNQFPKDALRMVRAAQDQELGLDFASSGKGLGGAIKVYPQSPRGHRYSKSTPAFRVSGSGSAVHLPMTVAS